MTGPAIKVEGLGKRYHLGEDASQHRIGHVLMPWRKMRTEQEFWALRDISFQIEQGESVGIIGRNGAGKSTLLKVLSRITAPTTGRVRVHGRVGTLLEVGTGFHPELPGRDNIFLSGTILGLSYRQVKAKFDEIVDFAEVGKFIDTPVKRYSSGMQVRLAFAVALYLDPEILIVDEVLAVGDLGFQRKSLNRLSEATGRDGRTVLFVSHSLDAVRKSCQRVIVLDEGRVMFDGPAHDGIEFYRDSVPFEPEVKEVNLKNRLQRSSGAVRFVRVEAFNAQNELKWSFRSGDTIRLRIEYKVIEPVPDLMFTFRFRALNGELGGNEETIVTNICEVVSRNALSAGHGGVLELVFPKLKLRAGELPLHLHLGAINDKTSYDIVDENVVPIISIRSNTWGERLGVVSLDYEFRQLSVEDGDPIPGKS